MLPHTANKDAGRYSVATVVSALMLSESFKKIALAISPCSAILRVDLPVR